MSVRTKARCIFSDCPTAAIQLRAARGAGCAHVGAPFRRHGALAGMVREPSRAYPASERNCQAGSTGRLLSSARPVREGHGRREDWLSEGNTSDVYTPRHWGASQFFEGNKSKSSWFYQIRRYVLARPPPPALYATPPPPPSSLAVPSTPLPPPRRRLRLMLATCVTAA